MKKYQHILTIMLVAMFTLCTTAYASGLDTFQPYNTYVAGQFSDIDSSSWYAENVRIVYKYGIMNGKSDGIFDPDGEVTVAEAIAMTARLHDTYYGNHTNFYTDGIWFLPYVSYAETNRLVSPKHADYNAPITRVEFAQVLGAAFPDDALPIINKVEDGAIPDIPMGSSFAASIYRLYRAGILTGNGSNGMFGVSDTIKRSAAAAIVSRLVIPSLRQSFTLEVAPFTPVPINNLANRKSLQKKASDEQFKQAYDEAVKLVTPYANLNRADQLKCVMRALSQYFNSSGMDYGSSAEHYNNPYGFFIRREVTCAGCARAIGLCLNILNIPYEHVNENSYTHQWCRVEVDGEYWVCDVFPYSYRCCPEPAPYEYPKEPSITNEDLADMYSNTDIENSLFADFWTTDADELEGDDYEWFFSNEELINWIFG